MTHYIPYARTDAVASQQSEIEEWLGVEKALALMEGLQPEAEFPLLVQYLIEFAGAVELQYQRMAEMLVDQAAISYNAHVAALQKIKARLLSYGPQAQIKNRREDEP